MRVALFTLLALSSASALADTAIETETAQIGAQGEANVSQSFEYEHAKDGTAQGTLTQFEYGISDRSEILIEPFFYLWDHPDGSPRTSGAGDLEITPSYMVVLEHGWVPAVLLAFKVKVPTGDSNVGGTHEYDYYPYLIFGQHAGDWTFNANLGVNYAQDAGGGRYHPQTVWDLEAEHEVLPDTTLFVEGFSAEDGVPSVSTALEWQFRKNMNVFLAAGYTDEHEVIVRPGINIQF